MFATEKTNRQKDIPSLLHHKGGIIISNYLNKYRGIYRLKAPYDLSTNQFPRKLNDTLEDIDVYIDCYNNVQIMYYGRGILECYIPSLQRGHNILKAIKSTFHEDIILDVKETASEVIFKFHAKHLEKLEKILKPKTHGADISPFSSRNLPKAKYTIPENDLKVYKDITSVIPKEEILKLSHLTNDFIKSLANRRHTYEDIKADMALKCLKGKEYIHAINMWDKYLAYLKSNL